MSIRQCRAVQAIADHGSFAAAARALNVAQSAISMQVASLEERLGVALFDRGHRPPRLTAAGRAILGHARTVVEEYDRMVEVATHGHAEDAPLRLGVIPTAVASLLPQALVRLREAATAPTVKITSALSGDLVAAIEEGTLDAALVHEPRTLGAGVVWRPVARQRVVVMAPPDSTEETLEALFARYTYIRFNREAWVAPMIEQRLEALGLAPEAHAEIQSIEAIRLMIRLGFGVSILPDVPSAFEPGRLRVLPFGDPPIHREIGFVMHETLARRPIAAVVTAAFADAAAGS